MDFTKLQILVVVFIGSIVRFSVNEMYQNEDQKIHIDRLTAVTRFPDLEKLYQIMLEREPHIDPDETTNAATKKRICENVLGSGYFQVKKVEPIDMDGPMVYTNVKSVIRKQNHTDYQLFYSLFKDFRKKEGSWFGMVYPHPTRELPLFDFGANKTEYAFVCLAETKLEISSKSNMQVYFVTDEYNIKKEFDTPAEGYIAARFVFHWAFSLSTLIALAEEPAIAIQGVEQDIEGLYRQMRKFYRPAANARKDPICKLNRSQKIRVCASVMNAAYFDGKIKYFPDEDRFDDSCALGTVHFQNQSSYEWSTESRKGDTTSQDHNSESESYEVGISSEADIGRYDEWMLSCTVESVDEERSPRQYFVSRAYNSHYVFVYFGRRTSTQQEWYLENISKNISVVIDECIKPHCIKI